MQSSVDKKGEVTSVPNDAKAKPKIRVIAKLEIRKKLDDKSSENPLFRAPETCWDYDPDKERKAIKQFYTEVASMLAGELSRTDARLIEEQEYHDNAGRRKVNLETETEVTLELSPEDLIPNPKAPYYKLKEGKTIVRENIVALLPYYHYTMLNKSPYPRAPDFAWLATAKDPRLPRPDFSLLAAVKERNVAEIKSLLQHPSPEDLNAVDEVGCNAFMNLIKIMCENNLFDFIPLFLAHDFLNLNQRDRDGYSAMDLLSNYFSSLSWQVIAKKWMVEIAKKGAQWEYPENVQPPRGYDPAKSAARRFKAIIEEGKLGIGSWDIELRAAYCKFHFLLRKKIVFPLAHPERDYDHKSDFKTLNESFAENQTSTALEIQPYRVSDDEEKTIAQQEMKWHRNSQLSQIIFYNCKDAKILKLLLLYAKNNKKINTVKIVLGRSSDGNQWFLQSLKEILNQLPHVTTLELTLDMMHSDNMDVLQHLNYVTHVRLDSSSIFGDDLSRLGQNIERTLIKNHTIKTWEIKTARSDQWVAIGSHNVKSLNTKALLALNEQVEIKAIAELKLAAIAAVTQLPKEITALSYDYLAAAESNEFHRERSLAILKGLFPTESKLLNAEVARLSLDLCNQERIDHPEIKEHVAIVSDSPAVWAGLRSMEDLSIHARVATVSSSAIVWTGLRGIEDLSRFFSFNNYFQSQYGGHPKLLHAVLLETISEEKTLEEKKGEVCRNLKLETLKTAVHDGIVAYYKKSIADFIQLDDVKKGLSDHKKFVEKLTACGPTLSSLVDLDHEIKAAYANAKDSILNEIKRYIDRKGEFVPEAKLSELTTIIQLRDYKKAIIANYRKSVSILKDEKINTGMLKFIRDEKECLNGRDVEFERQFWIKVKDDSSLSELTEFTNAIKIEYCKYLQSLVAEPFLMEFKMKEPESYSLAGLKNLKNNVCVAYRKSILPDMHLVVLDVASLDDAKSHLDHLPLKDLKECYDNILQQKTLRNQDNKTLEANLPAITHADVAAILNDFSSFGYTVKLWKTPVYVTDIKEVVNKSSYLDRKKPLPFKELLDLAKVLFTYPEIKSNVKTNQLRQKFVVLNSFLDTIHEDSKAAVTEHMLSNEGFYLLHTNQQKQFVELLAKKKIHIKK